MSTMIEQLREVLALHDAANKPYSDGSAYCAARDAAMKFLRTYGADLLAMVEDASALKADSVPVAWMHQVVAGDGEPDQALSFSPDNFPLEGVVGYRSISHEPLYTHPAPSSGGEWTDANVDQLAFWMCERAGHDDPHTLIWQGNPPEPYGEVWNTFQGEARQALQAAFAPPTAKQEATS